MKRTATAAINSLPAGDGDEACCGMCGGAGLSAAEAPELHAPRPAAAPEPARIELRHPSMAAPLAIRLAATNPLAPSPSSAAPRPPGVPPGWPPTAAGRKTPALPAGHATPGPPAGPPGGGRPLQLDGRGSDRRGRAGRLDRNADRRITLAGLIVAAGYLLAGLVAAMSQGGSATGAWLPLHLVLAGAAATAITAVMPFFSTALVAAPPARPAVRVAALVLVALGALLVAGRSVDPAGTLPAVGGSLFVAGAVVLGWATLAPLRAGLGTARPLVTTAYAIAIADVVAGALLATLFVAGWMPVVAHWAALKPAHAWLNLLGFVSLVIAATLLHLLPTVVGGRIVPRRSARVAVAGLAVAAPLVAAGFAAAPASGSLADLLARAGALAALGGAVALGWHAVEVHRARGRWSTDPGWHRLATHGLEAAVAWFAVAVALAAAPVLVLGAVPGAWRVETLAVPLAVGWVAQAIVAACTHLLPAIGPGGPAEHAAQRAILGRLAAPRLIALNGGVALLAVGVPVAAMAGPRGPEAGSTLSAAGPALVAAGAALVAVALAASIALLALAVLQVRRPRRAAG